MSMIVWSLLGFVLGLAASKTVSTTGEGTIVDILLGMVGAVISGWMFTVFGGAGATGFNIDTVYSAGIATIGAIIMLTLYHVFLRHPCCESGRAGFPMETEPPRTRLVLVNKQGMHGKDADKKSPTRAVLVAEDEPTIRALAESIIE